MPPDSQQLLKYCIKNVRIFPNIFLNVGTYYLKLFSCQETVGHSNFRFNCKEFPYSWISIALFRIHPILIKKHILHGILKLLFTSKDEKCFQCKLKKTNSCLPSQKLSFTAYYWFHYVHVCVYVHVCAYVCVFTQTHT